MKTKQKKTSFQKSKDGGESGRIRKDQSSSKYNHKFYWLEEDEKEKPVKKKRKP